MTLGEYLQALNQSEEFLAAELLDGPTGNVITQAVVRPSEVDPVRSVYIDIAQRPLEPDD